MALTLYHVNWCPECEIVRQKLADLNLALIDRHIQEIRDIEVARARVKGGRCSTCPDNIMCLY